MIHPRDGAPSADDVRRHYGDLDRYYREIWGDHVHHGLWTRGDETPAEAVEALVERVADAARIGPGHRVCDAGSGYGATARWLARHRGARVTALTLSPRQHEVARERSAGPGTDGDGPETKGTVEYRCGDWLENGLPARSFDAVVAIESTEHMRSLQRALEEACRVLRRGGRFVACVWLARDRPHPSEVRHFLEPICREGRLVRLTTADEYRGALVAAGFRDVRVDDVSEGVARTWTVCLARAARRVATDASARAFLFDPDQPERVFAWTMLRIRIAYLLGILRYAIITAER